MKKKKVKVSLESGIHARPAAMIAKVAGKFPCEIWLEKDGERVNAKSIMGIMMLALTKDSEVYIITEGEKEEEALEAVVKLFQSSFKEGIPA